MSASAVALDTLRPGARAAVRTLLGGGELAQRLGALGLTQGTPLVVLHNPSRGALLVLVRETRIAIGRGEEAKILVEPLAA
ncbi:MAG: ferrous iron transport protein A [Rubrivivax sp.]|nr:ferrous iron transport protein A [Rubrivivax sp.]